MSECCSIGIKYKDGTVKAIYCHNDGYIRNGAGEILVKHYTDETVINQLLELGDISSLGTEPIENPDAWKDIPLNCADWFGEWNKLHPVNKCDIYRTRGEDCPAKTFQAVEVYLDYYSDAEYRYLFDSEKKIWYYYNVYRQQLVTVKSRLSKLGD